MNPDLTSAGADIGVVTLGCNIVGGMLKALPFTPDWTIPLALPIVGAVAMCAVSGFSGRNVITGLACGWAAVGAHQALRQLNGRGIDKPSSTDAP
jgi:hypothetical protein